ncbi:hypothetical protein [Aliamphritea spongicola]|uniref:hypothetical protein n=1 Tax=Aliamphritea spongicola TaxID=707589 RepID=UPI00196A2DC8|nr:hypothetical protein [Aliamphritea spongicola]MBN3564704.1 hypothetical protein [Aliamphritea spongicola]
MNNKVRNKGSSLVEYIVIAAAFSGIFFGVLPAVVDNLTDHHDQYSNTLSVPN